MTGSFPESGPAEGHKRAAPQLSRLLRNLNIVALLVVIATAAGLLLSPMDDDGLLGMPALTVGQKAPWTIKAPRDFAIADPDTTERLRHEAIGQVRPTYDLIAGLGAEAKSHLEHSFLAMAPPRATDAGPALALPEATLEKATRERAGDFMRALDVFFDDKDLELLLKAGFSDEIRDAAIMAVKTIYEHRIVEDRELLKLQAPQGIQVRLLGPGGEVDHEELLLDYAEVIGIDQARTQIDQIVAHLSHLTTDGRRAVALLVKRLLRANLRPNRNETESRMAAARDAVRTVVIPIQAGETVLRAEEQVTERHLLILHGMAGELVGRNRFQAPAGSALLIVLLVVAIYSFYRRERRGFLAAHRDLALGASVYLGTLLVLWGGSKGAIFLKDVSPVGSLTAFQYLVPVAFGTLLVRFAMGAEVAAAFVPLVVVSAGWMMNTSLSYAVYALLGSLAAATVSTRSSPRLALFGAGLRCGVVQALGAVALALIESRAVLGDTLTEAIGAFASGPFAAFLVLLVVPAVEVLLGYTTSFKLFDLANLNHPLLRELLVQAPGTYHHSIVVGALAEAGARTIHADALVARVGGYYHDIGKIKNPRLFGENNAGAGGVNGPSEEAAAIRMHVTDGLELGAKHRLGEPILEIIAQHHGTSTVRALRARAMELAGGPLTAVDSAAFTYAGPKPLSREAGVVLLADCVESATEALIAQSPLEEGAIERTVRRVLQELINDGQLDSCALTLDDVRAIGDVFVVELREMLMRRGRPAPSQLPIPGSPLMVRAPPREPPN